MKKLLLILFAFCSVTLAGAQSKGGFDDLTALKPDVAFPQKTTTARNLSEKQRIGLERHSHNVRLRLLSRQPSKKVAPDMTQVVLEAHDVYGYGNIGYQMLLDKDHDTYGSLFNADSYYYTSTYDDFEYKIPADAEADGTTKATVVDGSDSTLIPAGVYDYMIVSTRQEDGLMFVRNKWGRQDDFRFDGGYTYRFLITFDSNNFQDVATPYADIDAAVESLTLPAKGMGLTASEPISATIINRGTSAISNFPVSYSVNGGAAVTETYGGEIAPGASATYTFSTRADFSAAPQAYEVKAWTSLTGDLIAGNDTATATTRHIAPIDLPFAETFASADDFEGNWSVISDGSNGWEYNSWGTYPDGDGTGSVWNSTWQTTDSWLLTPPLRLAAGDNHVSLYAHSAGTVPENLGIYYGTAADTTAMTLITQTVVNSSEWRVKILNFTVPAEGTYYLAFRSQSDGTGASVTIDSILVDKGAAILEPNLRIDKVLLPYSNCDLSDNAPVGLRLTNTGTGATSEFTISYSVNGGNTVSQTVASVLDPEATQDYYFDQRADLAAIGTYEFEVSATAGSTTNSAEATVSNLAPVTTLPVTTNFYNNEGIDSMWISMNDGAWSYDDFSTRYSSNNYGIDNGLLSRCITFTTPFRVRISYGGGASWMPGAMYVAYGRPGTDPSTWQKVYEDNNITETKNAEFTVTPDSYGEYDLLIVNAADNDYTSFGLYQTVISALLDHDQRITGTDTPLAPFTPQNQITAKGSYNVSVENRGTESLTNVKAVISAADGRGTITTSTLPSLSAGASATLTGEGSLSNIKAGDNLSVSVTASADEADGYAADNTILINGTDGINVTDTVFAVENITEFTAGTGQSGSPLSFGQTYNLAVADTLTSVSFGLAQDDYYTPRQIGVAVYEVGADGVTVGRRLFATQMERGAEGGIRTVAFPGRILQPGKYFFEIQQLDINNIGLSYVMSDNATCYQNEGGTLRPVSGAWLAVRANFGHGAAAYTHNVAARSIIRPSKAAALFSDSETVSVVVENLGASAEDSVRVAVSAGTQTLSKTIALQPYATDTVDIEGIDLSVPGEYVITATATVEGDENAADNATSFSVTSREEASPYTLDFESCNDFDTDHEFNPRWWTVNRSDYGNDQFWAFDYPHKGEKVGFMAFNVDAMTKLYDGASDIQGLFAHSGQRFGAAFGLAYPAPEDATADTWLVSPKLKLTTNSSLELYVKTHAQEYNGQGLEKYRILISDTNDDFDSFTVLGGDREAPTDWTKVTVDLSEYNNKDVYIALQYCTKFLDNYLMMVDDISVITDITTGIGGIKGTGNATLTSQRGAIGIVSDSKLGTVSIYDTAGRMVYTNANPATTALTIPTASWANGVYVARIASGSKTQTVKFVVEK